MDDVASMFLFCDVEDTNVATRLNCISVQTATSFPYRLILSVWIREVVRIADSLTSRLGFTGVAHRIVYGRSSGISHVL